MRTLEHHAAIAAALGVIETRMAALKQSFMQTQRTTADDALIATLSANAQAMIEMAAALAVIDVPPPPPPIEYDPLTGFPIYNGYPQNPETGLYHSPDTGEVLDPQPEVP